MDGEEGCELHYDDELANEKDRDRPYATALSQVLWTNSNVWRAIGSCNLGAAWKLRRRAYNVYVGCAIPLLVIAVFIVAAHTGSSANGRWSDLEYAPNLPGSLDSPFTGAFARFPKISALPVRERRITIICAWNDDYYPSYLRHFFYTMQLNADSVDLLMINRLRTPESRCLDFEKAGVNISWGGNINFYCMDDQEWRRRHVDFLCSSRYGWDCNSTEFDEVTTEYMNRKDAKNYEWRPFRGYVFHDLFAHPDNPFWAWMDLDAFVGNFARYPFNILSGLSLLTGTQSVPEFLFLAGQLTAFNLDDEALGTAWKKFPSMRTAAHFTKYIDGRTPDSPEEQWWSYGYLRSDEGLPGAELSYGVYPDIHGDDYYQGQWKGKNLTETYLISGRDILLASSTYTREEIEYLIRIERNEPVDDLGSIGLTGGEDGSGYLLDQTSLNSSEAKLLAVNEAMIRHQSPHVHGGIVEDQLILTNCTASTGKFIKERWRQCVTPHPLTVSNSAIMRASLVHFKEQQAGHILRRLERDQRSRGYERKLLKHHLKTKRMKWFQFPPFEITEDLVLRYNSESIEVFKMGPSRNQTLFYRKEGEKSIG